MHDHLLDPKELASRISKYANLRAAERAITPTVRGRARLPSFRLGGEILDSLQRLRQAVDQRSSSIGGVSVANLAANIDRDLETFAEALATVINKSPMVQLRATLPGTVRQAREEVEALLDFCLEPGRFTPFPRALVDYMITLLSTAGADEGRKMIQNDPSQVTKRVEALSLEQASLRHSGVDNACSVLRVAAVDLVSMDDLESIIRRMREIKDDLCERLLHPEVLRSVVAYNVAIHNRLLIILSAAREFDQAAHQTLASLRALDVGEEK